MSQYHADLFAKLLKGELSPEETEILVSWLGTEKLDPHAETLIAKHLGQQAMEGEVSPALRSALEAKLPKITAGAKTYSLFQSPWLRYAAVILLVLGASLFLFLFQQKSSPEIKVAVQSAPVKNDVEPGRQGAVLTLADGRTVVLDSMQNGIVATQNGSKILLNNGQLTYNKNAAVAATTEFNAISTPRGRQFQLTLSDGTKVWLNAASSLRYPTFFNGKERRVEITGEAYFEVAKNAQMPFKVSINKETEIEVLGTHFNVNSYENESSINTTLLEGSVKVHHHTENTVIKPGQQAQVVQADNDPSKIKVITSVNLAKVMAWKNGVFDFENATLEEVMRQLERWYDVDVVYEKGIPNLEFFGRMGRDLNLSNVLRGLQISKVHFRLEEKKLIVLP
jgi:transmembrane sensor